MIFEKLVLHNFGIYRGRHEIDLTPPADGRPIVLFGGLNGGGKTTFLHAIQLALYGKFAGCVTQTSKAYETTLAEFINKDTNPTDGAAVELHIQHFVDGQVEHIELYRTWRKSGKSITETFKARKDGFDDPVMADRWYEVVEGLLPSALSSLFFFDGEKIQSLADQTASSQFVKKGIYDLLGLDLVSTLISDLKINERRNLLREVNNESMSNELREAEHKAEELEASRESLVVKRGAIRTKLDDLLREEEKIKSRYRAMGGELLDKRESILVERDRLSIELHHIDQSLRELAAGPAPLLLIRQFLHEVRMNASKEKTVKEQSAVSKTLLERDQDFVEMLRALELNEHVKKRVSDWLRADRSKRTEFSTQFVAVGVSPEELAPFSDANLDEIQQKIIQLLDHRELVASRQAEQDRLLEGMPDPEGLEGLTSQLSVLEKQRVRAEVEQNAIDEELAKIISGVEKTRQRLGQIQMRSVEGAFSNERLGNILTVSQKAQKILGFYQQELARSHIGKLQRLILDSFRQLLRKRSLVDSIEICADSFELRLFDISKRQVPPDRLSAGERQLLSVAILWGLAKASGRPIPTIIDTPLGRLDGPHRLKLVENYFPEAAHQVILLSTDEEISGELYESLTPYIGHEYMLTFNEGSEATEVSRGYEFRGAA